MILNNIKKEEEHKLNKKYQINLKKNLMNEKEKKNISKLHFSISNPKKLNNNLNNTLKKKLERNIDTPSTSELTYDSNKKLINSNNTFELSKEKKNLFTGKNSTNLIFQNTNNNIIIPMIPLKRPSSNFNFEINVKNNKNKVINRNNVFIENKNIKERNNVYSAPHPKISYVKNLNKEDLNQEIGNLIYNKNLRGKTNKLHKIKIEKGMISTKLIDWNYNHISFKKRNFLFGDKEIQNLFLSNNCNLQRNFSLKKLIANNMKI